MPVPISMCIFLPFLRLLRQTIAKAQILVLTLLYTELYKHVLRYKMFAAACCQAIAA